MYTNNINIVAVGLALQCSSVSTRSPHPAALNQPLPMGEAIST